jgi:hypothetical protein
MRCSPFPLNGRKGCTWSRWAVRSAKMLPTAQCLGSLARILAADLAQHQSRIAAGHGGRRDDFRVTAGLKQVRARPQF